MTNVCNLVRVRTLFHYSDLHCTREVGGVTLLRHINRTLSLRGKQKRVFSDYWSTNSEGEKHLSQPAATIVLIHQCNDSENALGICVDGAAEKDPFSFL